MIRWTLRAVVALLAIAAVIVPLAAAPGDLVVFLVRHAEKAETGADPQLSPAGEKRAADLAAILLDSGIEHVHSSDTVRTRSTAAPIASKLGLEVELYDPRDLPALIARLRAAGGRHLVVGHSNTVPATVELLGGEPGAAIEEMEYDRLSIVTAGPGGAVSTVLLRF